MSDFATELEEVMHSRNFHLRGKINYNQSGEWQRFPDATKTYKRKRDLFVMLHDFDRGATFGDWHYPDDWYTHWNSAYGKPTLTQIAEQKAELARKRADQLVERAKKQWRARELWSKFYVERQTHEHPYVLAKRIRAYYARQVRSWLLVPVRDINYQFVSLQIIKPDGFKRMWKGTTHKHNMVWLSEPLPDDYRGVIRICEGYATGCTIYEAIGSPVVCALNAQNIVSVTQQLKLKFPLATLVICADNDAWTNDNPGIQYALEAMLLTGAIMRRPVFNIFNISKKPTDFNDLLCLAGIEEVENQLLKQHK
jgi:putative DNA primase/helicase